MRKLKQIQNWRSTLGGVGMILSALSHVRALADLLRPEVYGAIAGGVGLILCADAARKEPSPDAAAEK